MVAGAGLLLSLRQQQVESKAGLIGCFNALFSTHASPPTEINAPALIKRRIYAPKATSAPAVLSVIKPVFIRCPQLWPDGIRLQSPNEP